jgi:GntP family permease
LLNSQFAILEEPEPNEAFIIDQNRPLAEVVQEMLPSVCNQPKAPIPMASDPIRLAVVVIAIRALIVLITKFRIHPFIALILASWFLGIACGLPPTEVIKHFEKGFDDVLSFVGLSLDLAHC